MKPFDVNPGTYTDFDKKNNKEDPKFEVGDHVRISKYRNISAKGYIQNWSVKKLIMIKKANNTVPDTYVISHLNGEEIVGTLYKKELQNTNQEEFKVEKVIKGDKLYVKWKA